MSDFPTAGSEHNPVDLIDTKRRLLDELEGFMVLGEQHDPIDINFITVEEEKTVLTGEGKMHIREAIAGWLPFDLGTVEEKTKVVTETTQYVELVFDYDCPKENLRMEKEQWGMMLDDIRRNGGGAHV